MARMNISARLSDRRSRNRPLGCSGAASTPCRSVTTATRRVATSQTLGAEATCLGRSVAPDSRPARPGGCSYRLRPGPELSQKSCPRTGPQGVHEDEQRLAHQSLRLI